MSRWHVGDLEDLRHGATGVLVQTNQNEGTDKSSALECPALASGKTMNLLEYLVRLQFGPAQTSHPLMSVGTSDRRECSQGKLLTTSIFQCNVNTEPVA